MATVTARRNESSTILRPAQQSPTYLFPATTTWTRVWTIIVFCKSSGSVVSWSVGRLVAWLVGWLVRSFDSTISRSGVFEKKFPRSWFS